jgi:hypothetical protein
LVRVSDILALERKARLASERSAKACAGLEWKSQNIGRRMGSVVRLHDFHAAFLSGNFTGSGFRWVP